jgi:hypothetical protein
LLQSGNLGIYQGENTVWTHAGQCNAQWAMALSIALLPDGKLIWG